MRIDADVLAAFKATGPGWQTGINGVGINGVRGSTGCQVLPFARARRLPAADRSSGIAWPADSPTPQAAPAACHCASVSGAAAGSATTPAALAAASLGRAHGRTDGQTAAVGLRFPGVGVAKTTAALPHCSFAALLHCC